MINRKIIVFASIIIGISFLTIGLPKNPSSQKEELFTIEKGEGSKGIAANLEKDDMIWWTYLFRAYVSARGTSEKLQAGTYRISPSMSILTLAEKFASGDVAKETVTIPEGFTSKQILQKLQLLQLARNDLANLAALQEREGYLFPDTYKIPYDLELAKVIKMMTDNFDKKTAELKITPQIIVMASILEKEVKTKEEKELASGLLWKRIRAGWPLQVDADMWTYENRGLPEKPICNPGLESIEAAISPKDSPYWFYLATPEGKTIFSKTLEEHNIARAKYLK